MCTALRVLCRAAFYVWPRWSFSSKNGVKWSTSQENRAPSHGTLWTEPVLEVTGSTNIQLKALAVAEEPGRGG